MPIVVENQVTTGAGVDLSKVVYNLAEATQVLTLTGSYTVKGVAKTIAAGGVTFDMTPATAVLYMDDLGALSLTAPVAPRVNWAIVAWKALDGVHTIQQTLATSTVIIS